VRHYASLVMQFDDRWLVCSRPGVSCAAPIGTLRRCQHATARAVRNEIR